MELRHLRYFVAVAEEQHMTRAAARLGIQQPPLSQQIQDLERELKVQLFDRSPRRIQLNTAGKLFLEEARRLLAQADEAVERVRKSARGESGRISLGYTSSAAIHEHVPRLLKEFSQRYPLIEMSVDENTTRALLDEIQAQRLDAAFVRADIDRYPELRAIVLSEENTVVALPLEHPLGASRDGIDLEELQNQPFVMYRQANGPGVQDRLLAAFQSAGFMPKVVEEVPRLLSAITMVAAGKGVSILPRSMQSVLNQSVCYRPLIGLHAFTIPLTLAYRPTPSDSPLGRMISLLEPT
ncbi:LysR family transcriptional regulator [Alcaligenes faecalis]|uniref:LysR family transcriptional regulator n=1 Tax=Alcaligenes faecalis TaxID=511 RepID=UPI000F686F60|nr:LysR family transcriptional regulator [Alcaligenes faecalis]RSE62564.1 LysR family transcriptional regulator [Alcaligenes faecalis]